MSYPVSFRKARTVIYRVSMLVHTTGPATSPKIETLLEGCSLAA